MKQQEVTDLGEVLLKALKDAGINYQGTPYLSEEEKDTYRGMSPKQMAQRYIKDYNLVDKNRLLIVLQEVYDLNKKGIYRYPMREKLDAFHLDDKYYLYLFRHFENSLLMSVGDKGQTEYKWKPNHKPDIGDTEVFYEMFKEMKNTKLDPKQKNFVEDHLDWTVEQFLKEWGIKNPRERCLIGFKAGERVRQLRTKQNRIAKQEEERLLIPDKEIGRKKPEETAVNSQTEIPSIKDNNPPLDKGTVIEKEDLIESLLSEKSSIEESFLFLLNEKNELYRKIIKNQQSYISKLEERLFQNTKNKLS